MKFYYPKQNQVVWHQLKHDVEVHFALHSPKSIYPINNGPNTRATIDINFNKIFNAGPEVSLNGSPTVSPTTAAEC